MPEYRRPDGSYLGYLIQEDRHILMQPHYWRAFKDGVEVARNYNLAGLKSKVRRLFLADKMRAAGLDVDEHVTPHTSTVIYKGERA